MADAVIEAHFSIAELSIKYTKTISYYTRGKSFSGRALIFIENGSFWVHVSSFPAAQPSGSLHFHNRHSKRTLSDQYPPGYC